MGQFFPGKSVCSLCNKVMNASDEIVSFPAFLPEGHKYWRLSDSTFHRQCFEDWSEHKEFMSLYQQWRQLLRSRPSNLKTQEEVSAWHDEAFKNFPP